MFWEAQCKGRAWRVFDCGTKLRGLISGESTSESKDLRILGVGSTIHPLGIHLLSPVRFLDVVLGIR